MGYVPPRPPIRLNLDRHGLPRDFATYMWVTYRRVVNDNSPARRAYLSGPSGEREHPSLGVQECMR